ncbi:hypothetical protein [Nonomuraea sp. NPDC049504]|uniref:hypothetical protein n=1 Tax=Nonomuraea sp. NPDC049504 TaxID=3154729 RepID=UPI0034292EED
MLRYYLESSEAEIAQAMGVSRGTVTATRGTHGWSRRSGGPAKGPGCPRAASSGREKPVRAPEAPLRRQGVGSGAWHRRLSSSRWGSGPSRSPIPTRSTFRRSAPPSASWSNTT